MRICLLLSTALAAFACLPTHVSAATLDTVRDAGVLRCGVVTDVDDYSEADTHGNLSALGTDLCRAMAAEIFGDAKARQVTSLPDEPSGLRAVRDGKVDVLFGATPNPVVGAAYNVSYGPPVFMDGQGFLVPVDKGINSLADLAGRHVCFINASPPEQLLYDALEPKLAVKESHFPYSERGEMEAALVDGHCDAMTGDISWMANARAAFHSKVSQFKVLTQTISTDPFAPAFHAGDLQWESLVDWTVWVLMQAEEHGITRENVDKLKNSPDPVVRRLVGETPWLAKNWSLPDTAFRAAIQSVGNYGEMFERDVGAGSPLELPRGGNRLAAEGGVFWALPVEPLQ